MIGYSNNSLPLFLHQLFKSRGNDFPAVAFFDHFIFSLYCLHGDFSVKMFRNGTDNFLIGIYMRIFFADFGELIADFFLNRERLVPVGQERCLRQF